MQGDTPGETFQFAHLLMSFPNVLYFRYYYAAQEDLVLMVLCDPSKDGIANMSHHTTPDQYIHVLVLVFF